MLKYVSKFAMDILPSVVATIIGAYIVNHYIVTKPGADAPAAAAVSTATQKAMPKADARAAEKSADVANIPEPGVRAKGISEKAIIEQIGRRKAGRETGQKRPTSRPKLQRNPPMPGGDRGIPADPRRHAPAPREKAVAKAAPAPAPATAPVVATPIPPPAEAAMRTPRRQRSGPRGDRAPARGNEAAPRAQEAARTPDVPVAPRVTDAPRVVPAPPVAVTAPPVRPLPPPIMVSTPATEPFDSAAGSSQIKQQPSTGVARVDDPRRPTPPADIPITGPLDLRADAAVPPTREHTTVAEDMLLGGEVDVSRGTAEIIRPRVFRFDGIETGSRCLF